MTNRKKSSAKRKSRKKRSDAVSKLGVRALQAHLRLTLKTVTHLSERVKAIPALKDRVRCLEIDLLEANSRLTREAGANHWTWRDRAMKAERLLLAADGERLRAREELKKIKKGGAALGYVFVRNDQGGQAHG